MTRILRGHGVVGGRAHGTAMTRAMMSEMEFDAQMLKGSPEDFRGGVPLGRIARVDDVANAVVFLLSDQASHVTMHGLVVDGSSGLGA